MKVEKFFAVVIVFFAVLTIAYPNMTEGRLPNMIDLMFLTPVFMALIVLALFLFMYHMVNR